jgi:ABC-2 type transport system ATP-binding protein
MGDAIAIDSLVRTFRYGRTFSKTRSDKEIIALDNISINVRQGEIVGLLGPNGAGKTTLVKIISTVLLPTSGSVQVLGLDVRAETRSIQKRIGIVLGGEKGFYGRLSVRDNLDYWAAVYHVPRRIRAARISAVLERVGLTDRIQLPVDRLSKGMKQRLHLARGLVHDPELIILDEPTSGMDPVAAHEFRALVTDLRHSGRTILLATHDMAEAEAICDRIVLIDHGRILAVEHPKDLGSLFASYDRVDAQGIGTELLSRIRGLPGVGEVTPLEDSWMRIHTTSPSAASAILRALVDGGITALRTSSPSLEETYLSVIGNRGLRL